MKPILPAMPSSGLIAWFASNPIAANLLMLLILLGGCGSLLLMDKEVFPRFAPHQIDVKAVYPGAVPSKSKSPSVSGSRRRFTIWQE